MCRSGFRAAAAVLVVVAGVSGCSGVSGPVPPGLSSPHAIGNPSDTASPPDTVGPTLTEQAAAPTLSPPQGAPMVAQGTVDPAAAALAACLDGNWSLPVSREFGPLGFAKRSGGAVRGGNGLIRLTLGRDQSFAFTYDQVTLVLPAGRAVVNGPITGSWSLTGNTMKTARVSSAATVKVDLGPVSVGAPRFIASTLETLPPGQVFVTCTADNLMMQLPTSDGGGIVKFDRA